ncbi:MAG: hypothetical protein Q8N63_06845 [Nanoarchaeota archaeon]|nr:hypothetical protein [Nanoarchaeota archaeon]
MNRRKRMRLFGEYQKSLDKEEFDIALKQNRLLYSEIFTSLADSNGNRKVLEAGLDQLEIEATEILPYVQLNAMEEKQ